jgi:hypothetical protein
MLQSGKNQIHSNSTGLLISLRSFIDTLYIVVEIQGVIEMRDQILTTSYWLHVEKIFKKFYVKK